MKIAEGPKGESIPASDTAPPRAICPHCGGFVVLRRRRLMNRGGVIYFWRHADNRNRHCPSRKRPVN